MTFNTTFGVVLLGTGKVGRAVLERLAAVQPIFQSRFKVSFEVKGVRNFWYVFLIHRSVTAPGALP